jgi:hypothetical protein
MENNDKLPTELAVTASPAAGVITVLVGMKCTLFSARSLELARYFVQNASSAQAILMLFVALMFLFATLNILFKSKRRLGSNWSWHHKRSKRRTGKGPRRQRLKKQGLKQKRR